MKRKTHWWHRDGDRIVSDLCPRACQLSVGSEPFALFERTIEASWHSRAYDQSPGFWGEPIKKKPLNHFFAGAPVLSFGTACYNLGCKFCQNWSISTAKEYQNKNIASISIHIPALPS